MGELRRKFYDCLQRRGDLLKGMLSAFACVFKKDAFHFYKANWTKDPVLHLVGSRMTETTNAIRLESGGREASATWELK